MILGFQMVLELGGDFDEFRIVMNLSDRRINDRAGQLHQRKELLAVLTIGRDQAPAFLVLGVVIAAGRLVKAAENDF